MMAVDGCMPSTMLTAEMQAGADVRTYRTPTRVNRAPAQELDL